MQCWINGPATDGIDDKIKMANILLNPPAADQHSIIPFSGQIRKPQKTSIFSVGCRNSETLNIALGSCGEFHSCYASCKQAEQITADDYQRLDQLHYKVENALLKLIESL